MYLSHEPGRPCHAGFTLIEAVVAIVIVGIIAAIVAVFITAPVKGYADTVRRAKMTDAADIALRLITRELHAALPNSISCTSSGSSATLNFLPIKSGGRYREYAATVGPAGTPLQFNTSITQFDTLSGTSNVTQLDAHGQTVSSGTAVVGNLGSSVSTCDATQGSPQNTLNVTSLVSGVVSFSTTTVPQACALQLATSSSPNDRIPGRFYLVDPTIAYACGPTGMTRNGAKLSDWVNSCQISCTGKNATAQTISIQLKLTDTPTGESMTLFRQVHVENYP